MDVHIIAHSHQRALLSAIEKTQHGTNEEPQHVTIKWSSTMLSKCFSVSLKLLIYQSDQVSIQAFIKVTTKDYHHIYIKASIK